MTRLFLALMLMSITSASISQVGVGTISPQETLHVAGTVRVDVTNQPAVFTTKLFGLDTNGTLREVTVGTNLTLLNNVLTANNNAFDHSFGSIDVPDLDSHDNVNLLIGPGQLNEGKTIIRINRLLQPTKEVTFTGIVAGYDGQHIWIYAQQGGVALKTQDLLSLAANRIEVNDKPGAKSWEMIELVYDGTKSRWVIMQNHS